MKIEEYPNPNKLSQCCAEPMYSQSDRCPRCSELTGTMDIEVCERKRNET